MSGFYRIEFDGTTAITRRSSVEPDAQTQTFVEHLMKFGALYGIGFVFLLIVILLQMLLRQQRQLIDLQTALLDLKGTLSPAKTAGEAADIEELTDGEQAAETLPVDPEEDENKTLGRGIQTHRISEVQTRSGPAASKAEAASAPEEAASTEPSAEMAEETARLRLSNAATILDRLQGEDSSLELNRKLAYLQVEVSALKGGDLLSQPAEQLDNILQFQNRLDDFIAAKHAEGAAVADPTGFALDEVRRLEKVVDDISDCVDEHLALGQPVGGTALSWNAGKEGAGAAEKSSKGFELGFSNEVDRLEDVVESIDGFVEQQLRIGQDVTDPEAQLTRENIERFAREATTAAERLTERQQDLAAGFLNRDLTMVNGQVDIEPDLIGFCRHRKPDSPLMQPRRPELCQFANSEGPLHSRVSDHLDLVRQNCRTLLAQHEEQQKLVEEARGLTNAGKFEEAEKVLNRVNPAFTDLKQDDLREQIDSWRKKLGELEEHFELLKKELETPWERPFAQPWKVVARERRLLKKARVFEDRLEEFRVAVNSSENTEFVEEGTKLYNRLANQLNDLANTFTGESADAKISTFLHFALILECIAGLTFADREAIPIIFWTVGLLGCAFLLQMIHRALLKRTTVTFDLESNGKAVDESDIAYIFLNKKRYASGDSIAPGTYHLTLDSKVFEPMTQRVRIRYGRHNNLGTIPVRLCRDTYINLLEMKFVPVSGTTVLFSIWQTRVQDYRVFARETNLNWKRPRFKQDEKHPAVNVSWEDARRFCQWLTERERRAQRIGPRDEYRLPTDLEWSSAAELTGEHGKTPGDRNGKITDHYPWGTKWPPPSDCANLDPTLKIEPYDFTSKVGKFPPNRMGLFDLSGNVWEWCEDLFEGKSKNRTLRGGSWHTPSQEMLLSSFRLSDSPGHRLDIIGFRCVLEVRKPSPLLRHQPQNNDEL